MTDLWYSTNINKYLLSVFYVNTNFTMFFRLKSVHKIIFLVGVLMKLVYIATGCTLSWSALSMKHRHFKHCWLIYLIAELLACTCDVVGLYTWWSRWEGVCLCQKNVYIHPPPPTLGLLHTYGNGLQNKGYKGSNISNDTSSIHYLNATPPINITMSQPHTHK